MLKSVLLQPKLWFVAIVGFLVAGSVQSRAQFMAPELEPNLGWLNSDRPLRFDGDLKGHVVVLDFWTYCCINCIHVLPDLKYLEEKYKDEPFVVVGVHSAKFTNEAERESIRHAIHRYDIKHPVVIDDSLRVWRRYGVRSWPTTVVIGADGKVIGAAPGEGNREVLDQAIARALEEARERGDLAAQRTEIVLEAEVTPASGIEFPGKVLASAEQNRLFIADSTGHRVIIATYPDATGMSDVVAILGDGTPGLRDGLPGEAQFQDPQGFAFDPTLGEQGTLYVADTRNHAIRSVDLASGRTVTIAGTGERSYDRTGGKVGREQGLASPWALELSPDRSTLYIANAGTHQIWSMNLTSGVVANLVGSGRENSFDDAFEDAALAQPSGLALSSDGQRLYFADSESSSIRVADLSSGRVSTVVGYNSPSLFENGLFEYGDRDGRYPDARLQHTLGVSIMSEQDEGEILLIADTYNHKVKIVDTAEQTSQTWLGSGRGLTIAGATPLDEPGGLSFSPGAADRQSALFVADTNNHRILMVDPETREARDVVLRGLNIQVDLESAIAADAAIGGDATITFDFQPTLPADAKINAEFPTTLRISDATSPARTIVQDTIRATSLPIEIEIDRADLRPQTLIELSFAYCTEGDDSICLPANLVWNLSITEGEAERVTLRGLPEGVSGE